MGYPTLPDFHKLADRLHHYVQLKHERGAVGLSGPIRDVEAAYKAAIKAIEALEEDPEIARDEPDDYGAILRLRPSGAGSQLGAIDDDTYREKLQGALLARCVGCTLGAPVELWSIQQMEALARDNAQPFPPTDYWTRVPDSETLRYGVSARRDYTRDHMDGVPVDDDITYTLLGLLVAERYGTDFSTEELGQAWLEWLPHAMTAEATALENLRAGLPIDRVGATNNPHCDWIGAFIRVDPWGYLAPGQPETAARMGYRDAWLSHRRQGTYGSMLFAAAIAAAFLVDDPLEAIRIGLKEIPANCGLAEGVRWALEEAPNIRDYSAARAAVDERFEGMHPVHTTNNACLVVFGLAIGGTDVSRVISETVAMGLDNDCTAATAGSIVGAIAGAANIPQHWHRPFNNTILTYLNGHPRFAIDDVVERFVKARVRGV